MKTWMTILLFLFVSSQVYGSVVVPTTRAAVSGSKGKCVQKGAVNVRLLGESCEILDASKPHLFMHQGTFLGDSGMIDIGRGVVPSGGDWGLNVHICTNATAGSVCTMSKAFRFLRSSKVAYLSPSRTISEQSPDFGSATGAALTPPFNICYTLVSPSGVLWRTDSISFCGDAHLLPFVPSTCNINNGNDLEVNLGELERGLIPTVPSGTNTITKSVEVFCTASAKINVNMMLKYTPLDVGGTEVISSSANGLGVAVLYNGEPVSTSKTISLSYGPGSSNLELGFAAVRNPNVPVGSVPSGAFTASAVMVMTQQ